MQGLIEEYETLVSKLYRAQQRKELDAVKVINGRLEQILFEIEQHEHQRGWQEQLRLTEYEDLSHER